MVGPVCLCVCVCVCVCVCMYDEGRQQKLLPPYLGDSKFIVLPKIVLTFNHKTNNTIVNKIDHTF